MSDVIVGIDLGTTNSEIAAYVDGRVRILGPQDNKMLPSCVGISPNGELLVGESARNQQLLYPDRTVRSVKRKMGSMESVSLGEKTFTPEPLIYYAAALKDAPSPRGAAQFIEWLKGAEARNILRRYQYDAPGSAKALHP